MSHGKQVEKVKDTGEDLTDAQPQIKPRISQTTGREYVYRICLLHVCQVCGTRDSGGIALF